MHLLPFQSTASSLARDPPFLKLGCASFRLAFHEGARPARVSHPATSADKSRKLLKV